MIIHHSAGAVSKDKSNYDQEVRNIYKFHTQTYQWDDIGYNFLIAPNGDLYQGRDDQGKDSPDNIKGAHFCHKNSNTMGVCLLGNFNETTPASPAIRTLEELITWKLKKISMSSGTEIITMVVVWLLVI